MSRTAIVFTCAHAKPETSNKRFDWLGSLIHDIKPDMVFDLGDGADMCSLNSYDTKCPKAIVAQSYERDIEAYIDAQERLRNRFKLSKRKRPFWVGIEGNHEHRIKKAIQTDPRLEGSKYGVSFKHLETDKFFDEYHPYSNSAPAIADYDGVSYSHYFSTGNSGNPASGTHHAYTIIQNRFHSSTCGHSHKRSVFFKDSAYPRPVIGLVAGCFKGSSEDWAGQGQGDWWHGVVIKREIEGGQYEPEFISMERLRKEYG